MSIATALKSRSEETRDTLVATADEVASKGAAALDKASETAKDATDAALKEITALVDTLNEKLTALGADASTLGTKAKTAYTDVEAYVSKEVADRPVRTLAFVGLAGLVLGLLSRK